MQSEDNRDACFRTIISLVIDGKEFQFEGQVDGQIIPEKWGDKGLAMTLYFYQMVLKKVLPDVC